MEIPGKVVDLLLKIMEPSFVCPYCKKKGIALYQKQPARRRKSLFWKQPKKRKKNDTCYYCNRKVIGSPIIDVIDLLIAVIMVSVFIKWDCLLGLMVSYISYYI